MTRKDYEVLAAAMARARMETETDVWVAAVHELSETLKADNPLFDERKFKEACYAEPNSG